jgi:microcystin-dependent protein
MLTDGAAVSRLLYPELFALIGVIYGSGDGSSTFNLPDLRGRFILGKGFGTGLTDRVLAAKGGEEAHQLTVAELAIHTHVQNAHTHVQNAHQHNMYGNAAGNPGNWGLPWVEAAPNYCPTTSVTATNQNTTATNQNAGSNGAHNSMPPFLVITYVIKVSPTGGATAQAPIADSTQDGLMRQVSGVSTDFVDGTNACRDLTSAVAALLMPVGILLDFAGATAPAGFLMADGSAQDRVLFAGLFAVIGTTYGAGDGSTTFNLPDCRGRSAIGAGQGSGLTNRVLAAAGGEENHILTIAELASHTHVQNAHTHVQNAHKHDLLMNAQGSTAGGGTLGPVAGAGPWGGVTTVTATNQNATPTNQNTGSGAGHNTMPPFIALNKIIKT